MKNSALVSLFQNLSAIKGLHGVKFNYSVAKNVRLLKGIIEDFESAIKTGDSYLEYDRKRIELGKEHANKDEKGEPIVIDGKFDVKDMSLFEQAYKELEEEYKEAISEHGKKIEELNALLEEESSVELHKISLDDVPSDITTEQLAGIFDIINE